MAIRALFGFEGAANNLGRQSNRVPAVKVQDEAAKPVAGASVVFTLPADGPSGEFRDGTRTYIASTDDKGTAEAPLRANMTPGRLAIHVNVSYRGLQARTNITQFNVAVAGVHAQSKSGKKWGVLLAAVGGAAAAGVFATRRSSGSGAGATATPPIGISTGSSSVGPPR